MKPHRLYDCTKTSDKVFDDTDTDDSVQAKPSAVVEIISVPSTSLPSRLIPAMIVTLFENGRCAIWAKETHTVVFLNKSSDEQIKSIFYNRLNHSVIVVSVTKKDEYNSLKCRSVSLELITTALELASPIGCT